MSLGRGSIRRLAPRWQPDDSSNTHDTPPRLHPQRLALLIRSAEVLYSRKGERNVCQATALLVFIRGARELCQSDAMMLVVVRDERKVLVRVDNSTSEESAVEFYHAVELVGFEYNMSKRRRGEDFSFEGVGHCISEASVQR
jgi:hypothetical protein